MALVSNEARTSYQQASSVNDPGKVHPFSSISTGGLDLDQIRRTGSDPVLVAQVPANTVTDITRSTLEAIYNSPAAQKTVNSAVVESLERIYMAPATQRSVGTVVFRGLVVLHSRSWGEPLQVY